MIGSLMSRMGTAEKLSIPQLQKAIQDGTLPAFVGVPLLQQKVQEAQRARAAMPGAAGPQPSIAQQTMAEAHGIEAAQSNLPETYADGGILNFQPQNTDDAEHEYAGGGMIAFANRGLVDDNEEDDLYADTEDLDTQKFDAEINNLMAMDEAAQSMRGAGAGIESVAPRNVNLTQQAAKGFGIRPDAKIPTPLTPEAKAPRGLEALEERVLRQESGGRRYDKEGNLLTSSKGAQGEMQVMPGTQRDPGYGVKPARDNSPEEIARVGREYLAALYKKYGGDEQLALMAYNWGPGNVDKWIKGGKDVAMVPQETRKYASLAQGGIASLPTKHFVTGDPVIDNYGNVAGPDLRTTPEVDEFGNLLRPQTEEDLIKARAAANRRLKPTTLSGKPETKTGINSLPAANSGPQLPKGIARLAASSEANIYPGASDFNYYNELKAAYEKDPTYSLYKEEMDKLLKRNPDLLKQTSTTPVNLMGPLATAAKPAPAVPESPRAPVSTPTASTDSAKEETPEVKGEIPYLPSDTQEPTTTKMGKYGDILDRAMAAYDKREAGLATQREQDKYMAILAAGLGMMGGTSPHAMANIGQGGMRGIEAALASAKARGAEEASQGNMLTRLAVAHEVAERRKEGRADALATKYEQDVAKVNAKRADKLAEAMKQTDYATLGPRLDAITKRMTEAEAKGKTPDAKDVAEHKRLTKKLEDLRKSIEKSLPHPNASRYGIKSAPINVDD